jgi:hypothetical protein
VTLLLAAVLLGIFAGAWVIGPIVRRRLALLGDPVAGGVVDANARRRVALASLREIEYDRIGGKLDDHDYQRLKAQLEREALRAMEAADAAATDVARPRVQATEPPITHACGFVNPLGSRFCAGCGAPL